MSAVQSATSPVGTVKKTHQKSTAAKSKKPSAVPSHPPTQQMVDAAIKMLKERGGSSLSAIKKYLTGTYKVDAQKLAPFIKRYLKSAVASGKLIQTKGKGATGSFKMSPATLKEPTAKSAEKKKVPAAGDKQKKVAPNKAKAVGETKTSVEKKKTEEKARAKTAKTTGTVKATTSATKPKTTKIKSAVAVNPKTPRAKSIAATNPKKPSAKKAAAKK